MSAAPVNVRKVKRGEVRTVIAMAVPMLITICSRMLMDIADFWMISGCGDDAQAAILPAQVTVWSFIVFGLVTVSAVNTFVSQCLGQKRLRETGAYCWQGIHLAIVYGGLGLLVYPVMPMLFAFYGHGANIRALEIGFAEVAILTVGPTIVGEALTCFFNGIHRPSVSMWASLEANIVNVFASMAFIYGWFGFPELGMIGAAWGTLVGVSYRAVRMLIVFLSSRNAAEYGTRLNYWPSIARMRALVRVGIPQGAQSFSDVCVWSVFINILIGQQFGAVHLAANNIAWQFLRFAFMPAVGFGIALSALVGRAIGERDPELAIRYTRITITILTAYLVVLAVIYGLFRGSLIGVFNTQPEIVAIASSILLFVTAFQCFDGIAMAYQFALRGAGDTFWPAVIATTFHWSIVVGGGFLIAWLRPEWGSLGAWAAATVLIIALSGALWWRWHSRAWQKIDIFRHERNKEVPHVPADVVRIDTVNQAPELHEFSLADDVSETTGADRAHLPGDV